MKGCFDIVLRAVRQNGLAIQHAPEPLQRNKLIVIEAVEQNYRALEHVAAELRDDVEVKAVADLQLVLERDRRHLHRG